MSLARTLLRSVSLAKVMQIVDREYPAVPRKVRKRMARDAVKEAMRQEHSKEPL